MAFTSPTEDIIVQEGTFAFSYTASGTIKAGQAVYVNDTLKVAAVPEATPYGKKGTVGIAAYDVTDKEMIAVYGPGNIVRVIVSGSSKCVVGDMLVPCHNGKFENTCGTWVSGTRAVALETQATANGTARVLLL